MIDRYKCYYVLVMIAFWLMAGTGFIADEIIPPLASARLIFRLATDAIFVCLGLKVLKKRSDIIIIVSFLLISYISTMVMNHLGMVYWLNGLREFVGWFFAIPILRWFMELDNRDRFVKDFDRFVFIYLVLQVPCLLLQFFKYGAGDNCGGTWGNGASGIVSISICFGSYYLMTRRWNHDLSYWQNLVANKVLIFLLIPTLFNETKIVFILIPVYFLLLLKIDKKFGLKVLAASPLIIIILLALGWAYLIATGQDEDQVFDADIIYAYLTGGDESFEILEIAENIRDNVDLAEDAEENVWSVDLPRFMKIGLMTEAVEESAGGLWWGSGGSLFKAATYLSPTPYMKEHQWMLNGTRPYLFAIFMQYGLIGVIWLILTVISFIDIKRINTNYFTLGSKIYFILIFVILLFYSDHWENASDTFLLLSLMFIPSYKLNLDNKPDEQLKAPITHEDYK